jgi:hypothetical protein
MLDHSLAHSTGNHSIHLPDTPGLGHGILLEHNLRWHNICKHVRQNPISSAWLHDVLVIIVCVLLTLRVL